MSWIGVDLDGTLAEHYWPEEPYEHGKIGKPIMPMVLRVREWLAEGREVRIFTARVGPQRPGQSLLEAFEAILAFCIQNFGRELKITAVKDFEMAELWDDRAVRVHTDLGIPCCDYVSPERPRFRER